jgi:recombination protein RecT
MNKGDIMENNKQLAAYQGGVNTVKDFFATYGKEMTHMMVRKTDPQILLRIALNEMRRNPELAKCTPHSLFGAILEAQNLNLQIGGVLGEAYIIPYNNKNTEKKEANFQPGYKGLTKLAKEDENVKHIYARVIWDKERFDIQQGSSPSIIHTPLPPSKRGNMRIGVYAVIIYSDGTTAFEMLWAEEVEKVKNKYVKGKGEVWKECPDMMWQKTAIIRLSKRLSLSSGFNRAAELDEAPWYGKEQRDYFFGDNDYLLSSVSQKPTMFPPQSKSEKKEQASQSQEKLACPACGQIDSVIKGKPKYGGGWVCWKEKDGCGHKWQTDDEKPSEPKETATEKISSGQMKKIQVMFKEFDPELDSAGKRKLASKALNKELKSMSDLTAEDAAFLIDHLSTLIEMKKGAEGNG